MQNKVFGFGCTDVNRFFLRLRLGNLPNPIPTFLIVMLSVSHNDHFYLVLSYIKKKKKEKSYKCSGKNPHTVIIWPILYQVYLTGREILLFPEEKNPCYCKLQG